MSAFSLAEDKENDGEKVEEEKSKELKICAQCNKKIEGKFLLRALDQFWHEECLKCSYCNTQLSDLSFKFYIKGDQILCKRDYIRWEVFCYNNSSFTYSASRNLKKNSSNLFESRTSKAQRLPVMLKRTDWMTLLNILWHWKEGCIFDEIYYLAL